MTKEFNSAILAIKIIEALELCAIPAEPTPKMIQAGMNAGNLSEQTVRKVFAEMISAANEEIPKTMSS